MTTFFSTAVTIVAHTPIWVWPLYALLLFLGFQRTRDSIVPLWRVLVLPAVVTLLALLSFIGVGQAALLAISLGLVIGGAAGLRLEQVGDTRRLPDGRLWLRGEWWTFAQIVLVLVVRYATNVALQHAARIVRPLRGLPRPGGGKAPGVSCADQNRRGSSVSAHHSGRLNRRSRSRLVCP